LRALFAKHEPEHAQLDLNVAIGDAATLLRTEARQRNVTLDVRSAAQPVHVVGDATQIQQVLIILILNAMDAVEDLPDDRRTVTVSIAGLASGSTISVRDRGRGIASEHAAKLFDSFFSTKARGMGLGLSIARTIVESHGGRIWAENGAVDGAVFHIEVPAVDVASTLQPA